MENYVPFSVLNERLRPRFTAMERLCYSLDTLEGRQAGSLRSSPESTPTTTLTAGPHHTDQEQWQHVEEEEVDVDGPGFPGSPCLTGEGDSSDLCLVPSFNITLSDSVVCGDLAVVQENDDGGLTATGAGESEESGESGEGQSQRNYADISLPDLIRSGRPLRRRRTLGPVSDTLKEVRREVELSRRRSLKLKAQVDRLQESRDGPAWSQHRVTKEVLSILRLLRPLTEPESAATELPAQGSSLDTALSQLQNVARQLAIRHTKQDAGSGEAKDKKENQDSAILQQALCDRDDAMEKKKAMEAELLRSKTEMMSLNNQLLEAVQKRLELSLELDAWKEDVQLILQQQLQSQQQLAEQSQSKHSRKGLMRRAKAPIQRPATIAFREAPPPSTNVSQIFIARPAAQSPAPSSPPSAPPSAPPRNWRDRLRRGKPGPTGKQQAPARGKDDDGFQVVSLD